MRGIGSKASSSHLNSCLVGCNNEVVGESGVNMGGWVGGIIPPLSMQAYLSLGDPC